MATDISRNLRLVLATTLLAVWGYSHLARTPVLGDTIAPLLAALLVAPGAGWFEPRGGDYRPVLLALLALAAITWLLFQVGTGDSLVAFAHSPYFVLPVWALALFGLVRNATSAERLAASPEAPAASAGATEVPPAPGAPASWSGRRRS